MAKKASSPKKQASPPKPVPAPPEYTCGRCGLQGLSKAGLTDHLCKGLPSLADQKRVGLHGVDPPEPEAPKAPDLEPCEYTGPFSVDATRLTIHPSLATVPTQWQVIQRLKEEMAGKNPGQRADLEEVMCEHEREWEGRLDDFRASGIREALVVVPHAELPGYWQILDGRHRYEGGIQLGLPSFQVRCLKNPEATALRFLISASSARTHNSHFQRAFFALEHCGYLIGKKPGPAPKAGVSESSREFPTLGSLAIRLGTSPDTVEQAAAIHKLCRQIPSKAVQYRHWVMRGTGYQGIMAGDSGATATADRARAPIHHHTLLCGMLDKTVQGLNRHWGKVAELGEAQKAEVFEAMENFVNELPPALREHARTILTL